MKIVISTAEQMDALPVGSMVRDREGDVWERDEDGWIYSRRGLGADPHGVRRNAEGVFEVYGHCFPGTLVATTQLSPEPEPYFRTLVTYEVLTPREAFNGDAEQLAGQIQDGSASAALVDRKEPEEISQAVFQRLEALHDANRMTGFDISTPPQND